MKKIIFNKIMTTFNLLIDICKQSPNSRLEIDTKTFFGEVLSDRLLEFSLFKNLHLEKITFLNMDLE